MIASKIKNGDISETAKKALRKQLAPMEGDTIEFHIISRKRKGFVLKPPVTAPYVVFTTLMFQSFRYCLGRQTYVVSECVEHLLKYWSIMPPAWQKTIQKEITSDIERGRAGANMDVIQWKKILELKAENENNDS